MTGDLSAVWTAPLAGVWVFGAGYQHEACGEQDWSVVWTSGHFLWLESGCLVLDTNMKHAENKTCLWSGHLDISSGWSLGVWCWVPT